tara:strand:+ start:401 stop:922 length:522 start_codon:yes stop_codon:yes gene_type:complete
MFKLALKSLIILVFLTSCNALKPKKVDPSVPVNAEDRARKAVEEGRGISLEGLIGGRKGTNYEFSTSNPMWRASLETLDFLPLTTVDYSGGIIITDWYYDNNSSQESIKISLRFLSNDIRSESLKVIVHKKTCANNNNCKIILLNQTSIKEELHAAILKKAAQLQKDDKNKKK